MAQTRKRPLVGWLYYSRNELAARYLGLVLDGLRELGQIEGRDFEMVYRSADGLVERLPRAAEELVQLNPDHHRVGNHPGRCRQKSDRYDSNLSFQCSLIRLGLVL